MLLWIAMGYQFSKHASLTSYNLYQLLYGREHVFPSSIQGKLGHVVDLGNPNV